MATGTASQAPDWRPLLWIAAVVPLAAAAGLLDMERGLRDSLAWIEGLGLWGPAAFIALYMAATLLSLPGAILTLGAGLLFGAVWGSVYVSIASTLGATTAFLIGRYAARDWARKTFGGNPLFKALDHAVARHGWKIVGLARLCPGVPFHILKYAFGLTRVSLRDFFLASWVAMLPGTVFYATVGSLAADASSLGTASWTLVPPAGPLVAAGLLVAAAAVYASRSAGAALKEMIRV